MDELISIIITSYNYACYIEEAIDSILCQTYKNWELIIVDDASNDNSVEIIKKYTERDERIKLYVNEKNLGLALSIQKAISFANGKWISFLESDDVYMDNALEEKMKVLNSGADIIFTDVIPFQDNDKILAFRELQFNIKENFNILKESGFIKNIKQVITKVNIIPTFSVVTVKKELLEGCIFKPVWEVSLDHYLWAQLSDCKFYYINQKLTKWRLHKDSYLERYSNTWFAEYKFYVNLYYQTIKNRSVFVKIFLLLNYMRARLIYLKINNKGIKLNIANNKFIYEIAFNKNAE